MATIQRNVKTYGTRAFVSEVAAAPANYAPILSNEVDADLDTVYAAWNGGMDSVNVKDGSITYAKLAPDAQLWRDTGTTLTPGVNYTTRPIVAAPIADAFVWGTGTAKSRLSAVTSLVSHWRFNSSSTTAIDDSTKPAWLVSLDIGNDVFYVFRSPAGVAASFTQLLSLSNAGNLQLAGSEMLWGTSTVKPSLVAGGGGGVGYLHSNNAYSPQDASKASWGIFVDGVGDTMGVIRRAPAAAAGTVTFPLSIDSTSQVAVSNPLRLGGTGGGIRCQNVGTAAGDGYSSAIGFGWDGTLKARVDNTVIGTVTVTSDARLKLDVQEDVPGLDAVRALRPVSFEYDQTKREIGFPKGRYYGLIAQELQPHAPLVVSEDDSDDHWLEIDYRLLVPVLIRAIQELAQKIPAAAA